MPTMIATRPQTSVHRPDGRPAPTHRTAGLTGRLYRFHGFQVLDSQGEKVGLVDWIWTDSNGERGEFIGVNLRWLRGRVRAVPALDATVDMERRTVRVSYRKAEIMQARYHAIDRELTDAARRSIWSHFRETPLRTWAEALAA
jgi:hypothetical protein